MGQPAVEMPDLLQTPPLTDAAGADDLLSQLAGDEIDRLLAEADVELHPNATGEAHQPPSAKATFTDAPANAPAGQPPEIVHTPPPGTPSTIASPMDVLADAALSPGDAAAVDDLLAERGDVVLDAARSDTDAPPPTAPRATTAPAAAAPTPIAPAPLSAADEIARELDADPDRDASPAAPHASDELVAAEPSAASLPDVLDEALTTADTDACPFYLRPLQWLNAPFAGLSEQTRMALGKVAIVTFLNAVAVLVYVMYFRE